MADEGKPGKPGKGPAQEVATAEAPRQEIAQPIRDSRLAQMEAGLRAYHETAEEIDRMKDLLDRAQQDLKARDMEIASLRERMDGMKEDQAASLNAAESRATTAMAERDLAVREATVLKTLFASMKRTWDLIPEDAKK